MKLVSFSSDYGGSKNTSGYMSLTDSQPQFVFGSQCWNDNSQPSQGVSQEMCFSSRNSQQSSQEGSEQKISSNYHTKPFLFGGERKDKITMLKPVGILDKFEEEKIKAKEKHERDMLAKESLHFQEALNSMQQSIFGTEKNTTLCKTILEGFDHFIMTWKQNQSNLQDGIGQQFETLLKEVSSQKQMLTNIEGNLLKTGLATTELGSHVHGLEKNLEALKQEQEREKNMLEEAMKLLSTLVSDHSTKNSSGGVVDSAIQTSPGLLQPFIKVQQDSQSEGQQLPCGQDECTQSDVSSRLRSSSLSEKNKSSQISYRRRKRRRPLLPPRRNKSTKCNENIRPLTDSIKEEDVSSPLEELQNEHTTARPKVEPLMHHNGVNRSNEGLKAFISPFSPWSQDSNSSVCITGMEPNLEKMPARGLWQLFDANCDSDSIVVEVE